MGISEQLFKKIKEILPIGSIILELGSGDTSTRLLCEQYTMFSIEHDPSYIGKYNSNYIYAPIVNKWFDPEPIKNNMPENYDLMLIDGPKGSVGQRSLMLNHIDIFKVSNQIIICDDINRSDDLLLFNKICDIFPLRKREIIGDTIKSFGILY